MSLIRFSQAHQQAIGMAHLHGHHWLASAVTAPSLVRKLEHGLEDVVRLPFRVLYKPEEIQLVQRADKARLSLDTRRFFCFFADSSTGYRRHLASLFHGDFAPDTPRRAIHICNRRRVGCRIAARRFSMCIEYLLEAFEPVVHVDHAARIEVSAEHDARIWQVPETRALRVRIVRAKDGARIFVRMHKRGEDRRARCGIDELGHSKRCASRRTEDPYLTGKGSRSHEPDVPQRQRCGVEGNQACTGTPSSEPNAPCTKLDLLRKGDEQRSEVIRNFGCPRIPWASLHQIRVFVVTKDIGDFFVDEHKLVLPPFEVRKCFRVTISNGAVVQARPEHIQQ
jgi:hypothetical protein